MPNGFSIDDWVSPHALGLPAKFDHWRVGQKRMVETALEGWEGDDLGKRRRFQLREAPTGSGKSSTYMALVEALSAVLERPVRAAVLTKDKALQDQLMRDFGIEQAGWCAVDVRGRGNYRCEDYRNASCADAAMYCRAKSRCGYEAAFRRACGPVSGEETGNQVVVTSYAYWLAMGLHGQGINERPTKENPEPRGFDLLVLDEGHKAPGALSDVLGHEIVFDDLVGNGGLIAHKWPVGCEPKLDGSWGTEEWRTWGVVLLGVVGEKVDEIKEHAKATGFARLSETAAKRLRHLEELKEKLSALSEITDDVDSESVWELKEEQSWAHGHLRKWMVLRVDRVWPATAAEWLLFRKIPRVFITSGTLAPKVRWLLGIKEEECRYESMSTPFDQRRCPVYYIPVLGPTFIDSNGRPRQHVISLTRDPELDRIHEVVDFVDRIMDAWWRGDGMTEFNGLIHTTSYRLQKVLAERSRHRERLLWHKTGELSGKIGEFKRRVNEGVALVSPAIVEGYDFPDDQCRWSVLMKVPHKQRTGKVVQQRLKRDPLYVDGETADSVVQAVPGRAMRSGKDWCVSYIVDGSLAWWEKKAKVNGLLPGYWQTIKVGAVPVGGRIPVLTGNEEWL